MVARTPPSSKEIIELLSRLKAETPDYPANLLEARKSAFIKQAATFRVQGKGQGGEGGQQAGSSGSGGSGTALSGTTTAQSFIIQALIGIGLVATMLMGRATGNYLWGDQVADQLEDTIVVAMESPDPGVSPVPSTSVMPTEDIPPIATPEIPVTVADIETIEDIMDEMDLFIDPPKGNKDNPGLHLGQTPGTPAAPGQGNPGNINKPVKTEKPDKPEKPNRPEN